MVGRGNLNVIYQKPFDHKRFKIIGTGCKSKDLKEAVPGLLAEY